MNIGVIIRKYRKLKKIKQKDLAKTLGFTYNYICLVEKGKRNITVDVLFKLTKMLGIPFYEFQEEAMQFTAMSGDKAKVKSIVKENLNKSDHKSADEIAKGINNLIDIFPEPDAGCVIQVIVDCEINHGMLNINIQKLHSTFTD